MQHVSRGYISPLWLRRCRVLAAVAVLAILGLTLTPAGNGPSLPFTLCLACGPRWLADGVLNLFLFVPLGFFIAVSFRRWRATIVFGFALSASIEVLQTMIPGRDPSLRDVVFNTVGTVAGVALALTGAIWLRATPGRSLRLTASSLIFAALVMLATALLLSPADRKYSIVRHADGLRVRAASRATEYGLDQPEFPLPPVLIAPVATGSGRVTVDQVRSHWLVRAGPDQAVAFGPTAGQGWTLLAYPDAIARKWIAALNVLCIALLTAPIGFWARGRLLAIAAAIMAILLVLIPIATGIAPTTPGEWAGAAGGLLFGTALGTLSFPAAHHELTRL